MLSLSSLTLLANPGHGNGPMVGLLLAAEACARVSGAPAGGAGRGPGVDNHATPPHRPGPGWPLCVEAGKSSLDMLLSVYAKVCLAQGAQEISDRELSEMQGLNRIAKVVRRFKAKEQPTDFAYWQGQPYQVRLRALEDIRCEYHDWKYDAEPRLQRVYSVTKR